MKLNRFILSFFVAVFIFAYVADISKVVVAYAIYYHDYYQTKDACYNEKPDMYQSGKLYLKALIKRVKDICPDSKPKPPVVETNNILLYVNKISTYQKPLIFLKEKNRFVYKFSYEFLNYDDFFHPPIYKA